MATLSLAEYRTRQTELADLYLRVNKTIEAVHARIRALGVVADRCRRGPRPSTERTTAGLLAGAAGRVQTLVLETDGERDADSAGLVLSQLQGAYFDADVLREQVTGGAAAMQVRQSVLTAATAVEDERVGATAPERARLNNALTAASAIITEARGSRAGARR